MEGFTVVNQAPAPKQNNRSPVKTRAACDECRTKKLKCAGEQPVCSRCVKEEIACVYSLQKQMGRPKKRQRMEDDEHNTRNSNGIARHNFSTQQVWEPTKQPNGFDLDNFDQTCAPGGSFDTWLQLSEGEWADFSAVPAETAIPGLTPDSSSNSPPTLNLPPELLDTSSSRHGGSTSLLLDPLLLTGSTGTPDANLGMPPSLVPSCACLSTMYLTLSNLQTMDPAMAFPFALHPLREAMQTASHVLGCTECPERFLSALQNTQLVGTLLISIAERFSKTLEAVTAEAIRADHGSESKKFQLADLNTSTSHLHTGGLGCAAAFCINLDALEWRRIAKKVIRAEVYGPSEGNECCPFYVGLLDQMEQRQNYFHDKPVPADFPRDHRTGEVIGGRNMPKEDHVCLKYVAYGRKLAEGFDWS